ncbi:MAG: type II toxin-antitoxin system VapC family toxin [Pyrinomonadaceae bacterium]|jgi:predicted nucleic acid-binding protein|nr:type II toxin-antitoxin system VapC family toxin [Pyrinomonadaceae bacterium]
MGQLTSQLGARVYLDTNIIIYAVEGYEPHADRIKSVLRAMTEGEIKAVTSDLTLAEVLVKPKRDANTNLEEAYRHFLQPTDSLRNSVITREILEAAAGIRATSVLKLPDAIHFASAINQNCDSFLTNDERFESVSGLKVVVLSKLSVVE